MKPDLGRPRQTSDKGTVESVDRSKLLFLALTYQKHGELSSNQTGRHCPLKAPLEHESGCPKMMGAREQEGLGRGPPQFGMKNENERKITRTRGCVFPLLKRTSGPKVSPHLH